MGFVGVFLERTKYRIRVGRGLAPAAGFAVNYGTGKLKCERRGRRLGTPYARNGMRLPYKPQFISPRFSSVYRHKNAAGEDACREKCEIYKMQ